MAGAPGGRRLALVRATVLFLFLASILLPVGNILTRSRDDTSSEDVTTSDGSALHAAAAGGATLRRQDTQLAVTPVASTSADAPGGVRVLVFLVRESGDVLELHVTTAGGDAPGGVYAGESRAGESTRRAAQRILFECAALGPPPDVEFVEPVAAADGEDASVAGFVALVRTERLQLRGAGSSAKVLVRAPAYKH